MHPTHLSRLSLAAVACACVGLVLCAIVWFSLPTTTRATDRTSEQRRTLTSGTDSPTADSATIVDALAVIRDWDRRRAAAWATGDVQALRQLYVAHSPAASADVAMLRRYLGRGLVVRGLQTQILDSEVMLTSPDRIVLRLTDRVSAGVIDGPRLSVRLPHDEPQTRRVWLVRVNAQWLVRRVRSDPVRPASP